MKILKSLVVTLVLGISSTTFAAPPKDTSVCEISKLLAESAMIYRQSGDSLAAVTLERSAIRKELLATSDKPKITKNLLDLEDALVLRAFKTPLYRTADVNEKLKNLFVTSIYLGCIYR